MSNEEFLSEVGRRIYLRRTELGLTQDEVAASLGFKTRQSISLIERGKRNMSSSQLEKIAKVLNVEPGYLIGWHHGSNEETDNDDADDIAQTIADNPKLRALFDTAKDVTPRQLDIIHNMLLTLKEYDPD